MRTSNTEPANQQMSTAAIVPTMGRSMLLERCLESLRSQSGQPLEIVVVSQGEPIPRTTTELADRVIEPVANLGFAAACNLAIESSTSELIAVVNDDAIVETDWLATLSSRFEEHPELGAAQGLNLQLDQPEIVDGCGIAWNTFWRPVQIGQGLRGDFPREPEYRIAGVCGAAALYRRAALSAAALPESGFFDPFFVSFYEDVDLATRLQRKGFTALLVPDARALHQGGTTSQTMVAECARLRFRNRYLALARMAGETFSRRALLVLFRDICDIVGLSLTGKFAVANAAIRGILDAREVLPRYRHRGPALASAASYPLKIRSADSWPPQWTKSQTLGTGDSDIGVSDSRVSDSGVAESGVPASGASESGGSESDD